MRLIEGYLARKYPNYHDNVEYMSVIPMIGYTMEQLSGCVVAVVMSYIQQGHVK